MVEVSQLTKFYADLQAIKGVSFTAHKGETLGLLGPNGAGKTTTMRIIAGFMQATTGSVKVDGFDTVSDSLEVRRRIGYLPENPPLYSDMRVGSYLRFVGRIKGVPNKRIDPAVDEALEMCALTRVA
ncbi:MAG: ATP-binding cassette domain-containing protein, partial [Candidatus Binatia bacterium]